MSRERALDRAREFFNSEQLFELLARRVAYQSESQNEESAGQCLAYLKEEMWPYLESLGFECSILENPEQPSLPMLYGQRMEDASLPTVLTYGHGDTVLAMSEDWDQGVEPWKLIKKDGRWYGRGAADNKGQHTINLAAISLVLAERGKLDFNLKVLIDMGEEMGSPGLREICATHKELLSADVLIGSDGPRLYPERPTIYGGTRGVCNFDLKLKLREGGHHSGNWGGLLANPGIMMAHALASLTDKKGKILVPELRPSEMPDSVRKALADVKVTGEGGPEIDPDWGEPGLSNSEQVYGWNSLEVLAFKCGNPDAPAHAIPHEAYARVHLRYTVDSDIEKFEPGLRRHLDENGFKAIEIDLCREGLFSATRLDPENPWARFAKASFEKTSNKKVTVLPNLGGSLPNDSFAITLGMPTVWVPHSYGACSQHAPNEHVLPELMAEALELMTGLFWDLAENGIPE
jgi:acetylornithine deacetylase/succinyl-diaminopimelate desuccinylase-like protein